MLFFWMTQAEVQVPARFALDPALEPLALVLLGGSGLSFLTLSLSLAPSARGFGGFFALALLAAATTLVALASDGILIAFLWILTILFSYSAVWASGAHLHREHLPWGMISGYLAGLLCISSMLMMGLSVPPTAAEMVGIVEGGRTPGDLTSTSIASGIAILACLILVGSAPFHATLDEFHEAPAALGGLFFGVLFPILALGTLLRFTVPLGVFLDTSLLPTGVRGQTLLTLVAGGGMVSCAIGALQETRLRALLGWQMSGQAAAVLLAIAQRNVAVAMFLLMTLALTTLAGAIAIEILEQLTGEHDFAQEFPERVTHPPALRAAGILWALAAIGALGLPPSGSFWARMWLTETVYEQMPWGIPLMLVAEGIAALAFFTPLPRFWLGGPGNSHTEHGRWDRGNVGLAHPYAHCVFLLALVPLIVAGVAPSLVWQLWLQDIPSITLARAAEKATAVPSIPSLLHGGYVAMSMIWLLALGALWYLPRKQRTFSDPDMTTVVLGPHPLAQQLAPLAWLGRPASLMRASWEGMLWLSSFVRMLLSPFERRYYLSGVTLVLVSLIILMALQ